MRINFVFDSTVDTAPAGFVAALQYVAGVLNRLIANPITVNLQIGYGEVDGRPLGANVLGETSLVLPIALTYDELKAILLARQSTALSPAQFAALPTVDPTNGGAFALASAQAKVFGLIDANDPGIDAAIGFSNSLPFTFDPTARAVANHVDFIGVAFHEIGHALGRISGLQFTPNVYTTLDLYRYSAPGVRQLVDSEPAYFSTNGGLDNINNFSTTSTTSDWDPSGGNDANDAYAISGVVNDLSYADFKELYALGFEVLYAPSGPQRVTQDVLVNTATYYGQYQPSIATLMNGNFVIAWTDHGSYSDDIKAQIFAPDGSKIGSEFRVNMNFTGQQAHSAIASLSNGNFVVVWNDTSYTGSTEFVRAQIYAADGSSIGGELAISSHVLEDYSYDTAPQVAALEGGGFIVTWNAQNSYPTVLSVHGQICAADGSAVGGELSIASSGYNSAIVALTNGNVLVLVSDSGIHGQVFSAAGATIVSEFAISASARGAEVAVAGLSDGRIVVVWSDQAALSTNAVHAQLLAADGQTKIGQEFVVTSNTGYSLATPSVTALVDGRFVVEWSAYPNGIAGFSSTYAQVYSANGTKFGEQFQIEERTANSQVHPRGAALANGNLVLTYTDDSSSGADTDGSAVRMLIFNPLIFVSRNVDGVTSSAVFAPGRAPGSFDGMSAGIDTIDYSALPAGVFVSISDRYAYKETTAALGWSNPAVAANAPNGYTTDTFSGILNVRGTGFDDRFYGSTCANVFAPGMGNDIVYGEGGVDTADYSGLTGGVYVSVLSGSYIAVMKETTAGIGWSNPAAAQAGGNGAQTDSLVNVAKVLGSNFDDRFYGAATPTTFAPGMGNDVIYAGASDMVDYSTLAAGVYVTVSGAGSATVLKETTAGVGWSNPVTAQSGGNGYQSDWIIGTPEIMGSNFDDRFYGAATPTTFAPGMGNDVIYAGASDMVDYSTLAAGVYVTVSGAGSATVLKETTAGVGWSNPVTAQSGGNGYQSDWIIGAPEIMGSNFDDRFYGAATPTTFAPGMGNDVIYAGASDMVDYSTLAAGVYVTVSGAGSATVLKETTAGVGWSNPVTAQSGGNGYQSDWIIGTPEIMGSNFDDRFYGAATPTTFAPGMGNDVIYAGASDMVDYSTLAAGVYVTVSGAGSATVLKETTAGVGWSNPVTAQSGGNGYQSDWIIGTPEIMGSNFDDRFYGAATPTTFAPGMGADWIYGGGSDGLDYSNLKAGVYVDLRNAAALKETTAGVGWSNVAAAKGGTNGYQFDYVVGVSSVTGTAFDDRIYAGSTAATLDAGFGSNIFLAGTGGGTMTSQASNDGSGATSNAFVFSGRGDGAYTINGFTHGRDKIEIETDAGGVYDTPLAGATGALPGTDFYAGPVATIADSHPAVGFAYATDTHALTFWANGAATALGTVNLAGGGVLAASDFQLIHTFGA